MDDGWESLGDIGWFDADGYLYLGDRMSDMILTGGANVYPAEVEAALLEHPAVRSAVVIGLPDADKGNRIHAIVEADEAQVPAEQLIEFAAERIARYKLPRSVEFVDEPLRDDAGKVRRARRPAGCADELTAAGPPRPLQRSLTNVRPMQVEGTCDDRFAPYEQRSRRTSSRGRTSARRSPSPRRRAGRRPVGRHGRHRRATRRAVGARHDHQRVVDHQDDDGDLLPDARRPRRPRPPRAGRRLLARVRRRRQGAASPSATCSSHTAGLSGWQEPMTTDDLYDWEKATGLLAAQAPWWEPGTQSGYHAITQGYLLGEVVRRVTGSTVGEFFAAEVAGPFGADFHIGTPRRARRPRRPRDPADAAALTAGSLDPDSIAGRTLSNPRARRRPPRRRSPGGGPRSPPPAATATPARWPTSTP